MNCSPKLSIDRSSTSRTVAISSGGEAGGAGQSPSSSSPSVSTLSSSVVPECERSGAALDTKGFLCSICMADFKEPTITFCGHTFCLTCILATIEITSRCPNCGTQISMDKLSPNFALSDVMRQHGLSNPKTIPTEVLESNSPPSDKIVKLLTSANYGDLTVNELESVLLILQRRREMMASNEEEFQRNLMQEFLSQLLKRKSSGLEQLNREISMINRDLLMSRTCHDVPVSGPDAGMTFTGKDLKMISTSGVGFNSCLAGRKKRMSNHFEELSQLYFDARRSEVLVGEGCGATVPNVEVEKCEMLNNFGTALSQVTQYHGLKPLATLSFTADMLSTHNIVSSIEFDKDNEFFAIAGVTKKIKLFEYDNVIGSAVDIHCASAELPCNSKVTCLSWNNYFKNGLVCSDYDGCVSLWDVGIAMKVRSFNEHVKRVWSVDWSGGDPRLLASGSDDWNVKLWSTNSAGPIATLSTKTTVCSVKFCPINSYLIAFGSADHCVHYYDFRNLREPLGILYGHKKAVSYVRFGSTDELLSASTDGSLKLWSLDESMSCQRSFQGHINAKHFVGLATDGNYIACGSENNSVYVYHKSLPKPLFSFKFENHGSMLHRQIPDESTEFVSAVTWKRGCPIIVAANSQGVIKILELV